MNTEKKHENNFSRHIDMDDCTANYLVRRDLESLEEIEEGRIRFPKTKPNFRDD